MKHICAPARWSTICWIESSAARRRRGTRAGTQASVTLHAHLDLLRGVRLLEGLRVGVGDDELHAPSSCFSIHVVHRVAAGAAHAEHGDPGLEVLLPRSERLSAIALSACL
jgi:hypothetical protein